MPDTPYSADFYEVLRTGCRRSAAAVVPILLQLVRARSVVDVGCGDGTWLSVLAEHGIIDTVGIDGDYVGHRLLRIPEDQFTALDLSSPFELTRRFDLALSLEVAEHLPPQAAAGFVHSLTKLAPLVLFSAAIPFQEGTRHLNEQWPDYWAKLFKQHDYLPIDCIRNKVWENNEVDWWYAQNTLLFADAGRIESDPVLRCEFERTNPQQLRLVHPRKYVLVARPRGWDIRGACGLLARVLRSAAQRQIGRLFADNGA